MKSTPIKTVRKELMQIYCELFEKQFTYMITNLGVELVFKVLKETLTEAVTVCMYFEYNSMITINIARQVTEYFNK